MVVLHFFLRNFFKFKILTAQKNQLLECLLDIYDYVGKLPEQYYSVWLFSNPGDEI